MIFFPNIGAVQNLQTVTRNTLRRNRNKRKQAQAIEKKTEKQLLEEAHFRYLYEVELLNKPKA